MTARSGAAERIRHCIDMKSTLPDSHEMKTHTRRNVQRNGEGTPVGMDVSPQDRDIDRILAESFPASDPPPWTLGVAQPMTSAPGDLDADADLRRVDRPGSSMNE
jgi:hypothetical protein